MNKKPTIGAVVPCLDKRGGVRHFLEVGNELVKRGYPYTVFTEPAALEKWDKWFAFKGNLADWRYGIKADRLLVGDPLLFPALPKMEGRIFIWVLASGPYKEQYDAYYGQYPFLLINRWFLQDYPQGRLCELGVNTEHFKLKKRKVLFYSGGERGLHKQGHVIYQALSDLPGIELVELKDLNNDQLAEAYRGGDFFVSWEMEGGFSNTAAEALASGLPVVTNGHNCEPFLDKVIKVKDRQALRSFFENPMGNNTWEKTVDNLLNIIL